jgi:hypothetical protein
MKLAWTIHIDQGKGRAVLEYDSTDAATPHEGAYKAHSHVVERAGSGGWQTTVFQILDARLEGRQNGAADFRFYNGGDDLLVREVRVRRGRPTEDTQP